MITRVISMGLRRPTAAAMPAEPVWRLVPRCASGPLSMSACARASSWLN